MPNFDYSIIDGDSQPRKIRGEDLGTDGGGIQIIGHKVLSDDLGNVADAAATDETGSSSAIALMKAMVRELIQIEANGGGGGGSAAATSDEGYVAGATDGVTSGLPAVTTIDCAGWKTLSITVTNAGSNDLINFVTDTRHNSTLSPVPYVAEANSDDAYTTFSANNTGNSTAFVKKVSSNPRSLASGATAWIRYNVEGIESVRIRAATSLGNTTTLNVWWYVER